MNNFVLVTENHEIVGWGRGYRKKIRYIRRDKRFIELFSSAMRKLQNLVTDNLETELCEENCNHEDETCEFFDDFQLWSTFMR